MVRVDFIISSRGNGFKVAELSDGESQVVYPQKSKSVSLELARAWIAERIDAIFETVLTKGFDVPEFFVNGRKIKMLDSEGVA